MGFAMKVENNTLTKIHWNNPNKTKQEQEHSLKHVEPVGSYLDPLRFCWSRNDYLCITTHIFYLIHAQLEKLELDYYYY